MKNNSTSLKEVDLGYLCDVRAFRNKGYMEPEYQVVILKKE